MSQTCRSFPNLSAHQQFRSLSDDDVVCCLAAPSWVAAPASAARRASKLEDKPAVHNVFVLFLLVFRSKPTGSPRQVALLLPRQISNHCYALRTTLDPMRKAPCAIRRALSSVLLTASGSLLLLPTRCKFLKLVERSEDAFVRGLVLCTSADLNNTYDMFHLW